MLEIFRQVEVGNVSKKSCKILLSCETILLSCETILLSCETILLSCETILLSCETILLSCETILFAVIYTYRFGFDHTSYQYIKLLFRRLIIIGTIYVAVKWRGF